jgi:hypothetical protein
MYKITSQLCEVFDCSNRELEDSGVLQQFDAWLKQNPNQVVSHSLESGEVINGDIADNFFEFYKAQKVN